MTIPPPHPMIAAPLLVGRTAEVVALDTALALVAAGTGQTRLIVGEAGIGKSRLISEASANAVQRGFVVVQGNCSESDRALPYALGLELLRSVFVRVPVADVAPRLQPYADLIAWLLPDLADQLLHTARRAVSTDEPEQNKRRIFQLLVDAIDSMPSPQLVVAEDIHWADDLSLELLLSLARHVPSRPQALLITVRSDEPHPALRYFLAELERHRLCTELPLARFGAGETKRMIALMFHQEWVRDEFVAAIQERTDGNPFFIEETLRALAATGDIFRDRGGWSRKPLDALSIPRTVDDAVQRRLSRLSADARALLMIAAVFGRRFDLDLLQHLSNHPAQALLTLVKELVAAGLVHEVPPPRVGDEEMFEFHHALTQRAIYATLLARERRLLHSQALSAIKAVHPNTLDQYMADLAVHAFAAGLWNEAHTYASRAGELALALLAPHAAVEHLSRALEALALGRAASSSDEVPIQIALLRRRARAYELLNQFERARADHEAALAASQHTGDPQSEWQSLFDLGFLWTSHDMAQARAYLEQALAAARAIGDAACLGQSLNRIGNWHLNMGAPSIALAHHAEARVLFGTLGDRSGLAITDDLLGIANLVRGDFLTGATHYAQAIAGFRTTNNLQGLVYALATLSMLGGTLQCNTVVVAPQTHRESVALAEEAIQLAQQLHWHTGEANSHAYLAMAMCERGDYARAIGHGETALNIALEIDSPVWEFGARMALGATLMDLMAYSAAHMHLHGAIALASQLGALEQQYLISGITALMFVRQQSPARAEQALDAVPPLPFSAEQTVGKRMYWCAQAALAIARNQPTAALELLDALIAHAPHTATGAVIPRLWRLRAEALHQLNQFEQAEATLLAAEATAQQYAHGPILWQVQLSLVSFYRGRRRIAQSQAYEQIARTTARQLAASIADDTLRETFLDQFEKLLPASLPPTALRAAKQSYDGLTARERQVAALVAAGMSNRAIAEQLVVSERTIEKHVENALGKLMFSSRAQLAVWAVEHRLRGESA